MTIKTLILGGYGAVGREAAAALTGWDVDVVVAGRNPRPVPGAKALRVDAADPADLAAALDGIDVVLMCAEIDNVRVARACVERGIHYVDVTASRHLIHGLARLDGLAGKHDATVALSVGLVPGVSNLLARICADRSQDPDLSIGALLGAGDSHGPAALTWTLDGLGRLAGSWTMTFPPPFGDRVVHRFPFSDQFTLPDTLYLRTARTGLCLDSRLTTRLLAAAGHPVVAPLLRHRRVRDLLGKTHIGSDAFAVVAAAGQVRVGVTGRRQSRATGRTAALLIRRLPELPRGAHHIEQLVEPVEFLTELSGAGFDLHLDPW
ncbi:saccharopine dehydrogenase NADP-binding domain-containing protein [Nonomuraea longicatena]|uniref:Trans-acting enoyl reductase family protein n=1 Tax=Nonomuraea longicatena TaxID=83682 RepID=A0ABN1PB35_9ACTN